MVVDTELLKAVLDASPSVVLVLNSCRQIVYYNRALLDLLQIDDPGELLGRRPGEAVGCLHADECQGGCGTSESCQYCGALITIMEGLGGRTATRECRITRVVEGRTDALDLAVASRPLVICGERFVVFSLADISHEKRRRALERIFFHDVLNTASCVQGLADVVAQLAGGSPMLRSVETLRAASRQLVHEITNQRTLLAAEINEVVLEPAPVSTLELLVEEVGRYGGFPVARQRKLEIDPESADIRMLTDRGLLGRVIGNMLSNALEASKPGSTVLAGCRESGNEVEFWVHNHGVMPREVQMQIFQRSFSTKGGGRGLGTYSMKLLTENYLGGQISFSSSPEEGTVFRARYPRVR
jgi:signal transduction histidine kinase